MSVTLAKSFMSTKLEIKNSLRENGVKSSDKTASPHSSLTPAPTSTSISMLYYHLSFQYYDAYNEPYHQSEYPSSL